MRSLNIDNPKKITFASLMTILLFSWLLMVMLPLTAAQSGDVMSAPPLTVIPTIDGNWSLGEWDDATEYAITGPGGTSYLRIKHNNTHVFIVVDSPWDTTLASVYDSENLWIAFDTMHNHGSDPQTDDWLFDNPHSSKQVDMESWNGTGTGWSDPTFEPNATDYYAEGSSRVPWGGGGIGLQPSPHSATPHRIDEIRMPKQFVVDTGNIGGIYVMVVDDTDTSKYVEWPSGAGGDSNGWPPWESPSPAPSAWGALLLQTAVSMMYAPPQTVPATVDGAWSLGEWDDAPQYTMTNSTGGNVGYIRAKFSTTHLFIIIDSPWDTTNASVFYHENAWLAFDTLNNGGTAPQSDDYLVHPTTSWTSAGWVGNGTGWAVNVMSGVSAVQAGENNGTVPLGTSPNSGTPHRITEMSVPLTYVGKSGSTLGFYVLVDDDSKDPDGTGNQPSTSYSEWPIGAGGSPGWPGGWSPAPCPAPSSWGTLRLAVLGVPSWDVDGNGIIDIVDIVIIALAFGSTPSDGNWDPRADIAAEYGLIDIVDVVKCALNFGDEY